MVCVGVLGITVASAGACGGGSQSHKTSTVTQTVQPTTTAQAGADWKYLKTQYSALLGRACGSNVDPGGMWAACVGMQNVDMDSFYRDAQTLPMSKDRADLLKQIEDFKQYYEAWFRNGCVDSKTSIKCMNPPLMMDWCHQIMVNLVDRNAGT
jgi:hypothetical protein